jgi:hypothetical protein
MAKSKSTYDMPNMKAVTNESRPYTDPKATYRLAQQARDAQTRGAVQRGRS